jgi:hypothetical protein
MLRSSYAPSGKFVHVLLQRTLNLALMLALSLGSTGQATMAQAAPPAQEVTNVSTRYHFSIRTPPDPICVGRDYDIAVIPLADTSGNYQGQKIKFDTKGLANITIGALVKNKSIGTLSPSKQVSGFAWAIAHALESTMESDNPGEALFKFHAKKAGETDLYFEALINGKYVGPVVPIKVVNCKYKLTMNYLMRQSSHGTTGLLFGHLDTLLEGNGEVYQGSGVLDSDRTEAMAPCSFSSAGFDNPATITGKLTGSPDNQQLEVAVDYEPGESSATITCPIVGARTTTTTEDPTNWLATNATFLGTGGAQSFPIDFAQWFGRLIITVTPVEGSTS